MSWRLAKSLEVLRAQVDATHPDRPKGSDGTIGDRAHRNRKSAHNPDRHDVVRAWDCTAPVGHEVANALVDNPDPRLRLVISKGRIATEYEYRGIPPWTWRRYTGSNPHNTHAHIEVLTDPDVYDQHQQWNLGGEEVVTARRDIEYFQRILARAYPERDGKGPPYNLTGEAGRLGPKTVAAIKDWQTRRGIEVTGTLNVTTCCSLQSHANLAYVDRG